MSDVGAEARVHAAENFLRDNDLTGLSTEQARLLVSQAGFPFRDCDVAQPILSADLQPARITAMVKDGVVLTAKVTN